MFTVTVLLGSVTFFFLNSLSELVAFWADYIWSLGVLSQFFARFLGGALVPLAFFPDWAQTILHYTPFPYLIDVPLQIMFNQVSIVDFAINLLILGSWTLFFYLMSQLLWKRGQYSYTGVGI